MKWMLCAAVALAASCHSDLVVDSLEAPAVGPRANAGTGTGMLVGSTITLDASATREGDTPIRTYRWAIQRPPGSEAAPQDSAAPVTSVVFDQPGFYSFRLTVVDEAGLEDADVVNFTADAPRVDVDAGVDRVVELRSTAIVSGTYDVEASLTTGVPTWRIVSAPAGSTATLQEADSLTASFVPDREGEYTLELAITTEFGTHTDTLVVTAAEESLLLPGGFVGYSSTLDRLILYSASPPALYRFDPHSGSVVTLPVPAVTYQDFELDPGGTRIALTHDSRILVVDLATMTLTHTIDVPYVGAIVPRWYAAFGPANQIYLFPYAHRAPIRTVDLTTSTVTESTQDILFTYPFVLTRNGATILVSPGKARGFGSAPAPIPSPSSGSSRTAS